MGSSSPCEILGTLLTPLAIKGVFLLSSYLPWSKGDNIWYYGTPWWTIGCHAYVGHESPSSNSLSRRPDGNLKFLGPFVITPGHSWEDKLNMGNVQNKISIRDKTNYLKGSVVHKLNISQEHHRTIDKLISHEQIN